MARSCVVAGSALRIVAAAVLVLGLEPALARIAWNRSENGDDDGCAKGPDRRRMQGAVACTFSARAGHILARPDLAVEFGKQEYGVAAALACKDRVALVGGFVARADVVVRACDSVVPVPVLVPVLVDVAVAPVLARAVGVGEVVGAA